jgi:aspartyl-tRNA(Asn)/glutamyl-tRNA(Gln) amidotransferase subunit A
MTDVWWLSVEELLAALRAGELAADELCAAFLRRARDVDAQLACFVQLDEAAADGVAPPGPLHGVPYAHKDVFAHEGRRPTVGVAALELPLRARSAEVLDRLAAAGAIAIGTLNLDPIAYAATGLNPDFGDARNPWAPERITGGSSGGAAAAVAAGAVPFAVGSDAGGSIRIPAAFCGVTGLKPTHGAVPTGGAVPLTYSQDTIGIIARSARDVALVTTVAAATDLSAGLELEGVRVGVDRAFVEERVSADAVHALDDALYVLRELGGRVVEVELAPLDRFDVAATVLTWAEALAVHERSFAAAPDAYAPVVRGRLELALAAHGADHVNALRLRGRALRELLTGPLAAADVIVAPTTSGAAPTIASLAADATAVSLEQLRLNRPFNFAGVPSVSLPMGFDRQGLPLGFQIAGRPWSEPTLLAVAAAYQAVTDWHLRRPPLFADASVGGPT